MYSGNFLNDPECRYATLLSPATKLALAAASEKWSDWLGCDDSPRMVAAAFRAAAAQMIKTGDLTDTAEDIIRGAERHRQAGWLCTMAAELDKVDD